MARNRGVLFSIRASVCGIQMQSKALVEIGKSIMVDGDVLCMNLLRSHLPNPKPTISLRNGGIGKKTGVGVETSGVLWSAMNSSKRSFFVVQGGLGLAALCAQQWAGLGIGQLHLYLIQTATASPLLAYFHAG